MIPKWLFTKIVQGRIYRFMGPEPLKVTLETNLNLPTAVMAEAVNAAMSVIRSHYPRDSYLSGSEIKTVIMDEVIEEKDAD